MVNAFDNQNSTQTDTKSTAAAFAMVHVAGKPYERGVSHGCQAGEQIARGLDIYKDAFYNAGIGWEQAMNFAKQFSQQVRLYDNDMYTEIEGIAKGSEQAVEAIVALNARTEIVFWRDNEQHQRRNHLPPMQEECTAALALPAATADGHVLHGQNWDWNPRCADACIVLRIDNIDGPDILTFIEAGQLARHGMNSDGIALTVNGLQCDRDCGHVGVPNPLLRRRILQSTNFAGAIGTVLDADISFSHNLMLSHASGSAVTFETTPDSAFWLQPENGILVHANHFKCPIARAKLIDIGLQRCPESIYRDQRMQEYLHADIGKISIDTFKAGFADRFGAPDAILRTPKARPGGNLSGTVATLIMDTTAHTMWLAPSPYKCSGQAVEFTQYSLDF